MQEEIKQTEFETLEQKNRTKNKKNKKQNTLQHFEHKTQNNT